MSTSGPRPVRHATVTGRRPVVATLDTGCGAHPWLSGAVRTDVRGTDPIGYVDDETNPEMWWDQVGALDGGIDALAGHGTFIAGLIHQACPDADIVAWRVVGPRGRSSRATWSRRSRTSRSWRGDTAMASRTGTRSTCSACRWATTTRRRRTSSSTRRCTTSCRELGECGVAVVCSAGNDATDGPSSRRRGVRGSIRRDDRGRGARAVPIVSVGALNPNGTDALFSNAGPWVRAHDFGASVMSTLPAFQGGLEPMARPRHSGASASRSTPMTTRHSSPCGAGRPSPAPPSPGGCAAALLGGIDPAHDGGADAVQRGWAAVAALTDITT